MQPHDHPDVAATWLSVHPANAPRVICPVYADGRLGFSNGATAGDVTWAPGGQEPRFCSHTSAVTRFCTLRSGHGSPHVSDEKTGILEVL